MFFEPCKRPQHPEVFCCPAVEVADFSQQTALGEFFDNGTRWPTQAKKSSAVKRYRVKLMLSQLSPVAPSPLPGSLRYHLNSHNFSPQLQLSF